MVRERLVVYQAKRQSITNPEKTIHSIKRFMGSSFDEVKGEVPKVPYKVVSEGGSPKVQIDKRTYSTPQEISKVILQKMKQTIEEYLGQSVTDAVITVPAYFNDAQRQLTKEISGEI